MARRIALLIATDTYADDGFPCLRTPCTDAVGLAELLGDPGIGAFEVTTLPNRPVQEIRQVLDETFNDARREDLVLLHVSGHGIKDEAGKLHFVMSDTRRRHLRASAIAATWVRELIDHCAARRIVVWLDCCYSGAFPPGFTPKGTETVDAVDQLTGDSGRGCAVMTASTKIQHAFEQGQMSIFTQAIVEGLRSGDADLNHDGLVDVSELYSYVFDWVRSRTPNQSPTRNDMLSGDIYIAHRTKKIGRVTAEEPVSAAADVSRKAAKYEFLHSAKAFPKFWKFVRQPYLTGMAFDPADPRRVCVSGNNMINYLDVATAIRVDGPMRKPFGQQVLAIAFSPDGHLLAMATDDTTPGWTAAPPSLAVGAQTVAFSPDGALIATADPDIQLWDASSLEKVGTIPSAHPGSTSVIVFSPDSRLLASGGWSSQDSAVRLWDTRTLELIAELRGHGGEVRAATFSPDGQLLAVAGYRDDVCLWDVGSRRLVRRLFNHGRSVSSLVFSPDGRDLVSGSLDRTVRAWDLDGRTSPSTLGELPAAVVAVDFNPAGDTLAAACVDGQVLFWERRVSSRDPRPEPATPPAPGW